MFPALLRITTTFGSKVGETEGLGMGMLAVTRGLFEVEIEPTVRSLIGKPSINDLLLHNHNIL